MTDLNLDNLTIEVEGEETLKEVVSNREHVETLMRQFIACRKALDSIHGYVSCPKVHRPYPISPARIVLEGGLGDQLK